MTNFAFDSDTGTWQITGLTYDDVLTLRRGATLASHEDRDRLDTWSDQGICDPVVTDTLTRMDRRSTSLVDLLGGPL